MHKGLTLYVANHCIGRNFARYGKFADISIAGLELLNNHEHSEKI